MDTPKTRFLNTLVSHLTTLAQMSDDMEELYKTYFDRGYNVAGAAQITDNDLTAAGLVGMTATDVSNIINLME